MKKITKNEKETSRVAKEFLDKILAHQEKQEHSGAVVVGLSGNLGAGKTTLVQAVAKHLAVKEVVNSPTFVIIKKYTLKNKGPHQTLFHVDAYRLKGSKELEALGWKEILKDARNLVFIEWPENVAQAIPKHAKRIHIAHLKNKKNKHRRLELK